MKGVLSAYGIHHIPGVDCPADLSGYSSRDINQQTTCETLGTKEIDGIPAAGIRLTTITPLGAIGNDKPIANVTEMWTSPELKIVLFQRVTSPQTGETIIRITKISRGEPGPEILRVPADYKVTGRPNISAQQSGSRSDTGPRHSQKGCAGGIGSKSGGLENCSASRTKVPRDLSARFLSTPNANIAAYARITESRNARELDARVRTSTARSAIAMASTSELESRDKASGSSSRPARASTRL
jgi:hypothetical protein